jgi:hypothetical protein
MGISRDAFYDKIHKKDIWKVIGDRFVIEIVHHVVKLPENTGFISADGGHRWAVYAYIHSNHPLFQQFGAGESHIDPVLNSMPLHCGCSYHKRHFDDLGMLTCRQIGADYHHDGEWKNTFAYSLGAVPVVVEDAAALYNYLTGTDDDEPIADGCTTDEVFDDHGGPAVATEDVRVASESEGGSRCGEVGLPNNVT